MNTLITAITIKYFDPSNRMHYRDLPSSSQPVRIDPSRHKPEHSWVPSMRKLKSLIYPQHSKEKKSHGQREKNFLSNLFTLENCEEIKGDRVLAHR